MSSNLIGLQNWQRDAFVFAIFRFYLKCVQMKAATNTRNFSVNGNKTNSHVVYFIALLWGRFYMQTYSYTHTLTYTHAFTLHLCWFQVIYTFCTNQRCQRCNAFPFYCPTYYYGSNQNVNFALRRHFCLIFLLELQI